jgi:hypothetical protein
MTLRALFVSYATHLGRGGGGVQKCSTEYLSALRSAGVSVDVVPVDSDRRLWVRAARRLHTSPFFKPIGRDDLAKIRDRLADVDILLLNQVALAGALDEIGPPGSGPARVLFSHGCEITDMVHTARLRHRLPLEARLRPTPSLALGSVLADEARTRSLVDGVVAISPFDAECEVWLGTKRVIWLPRTVKSVPLDWAPTKGRFGYVGTLNHAPNLEGLVSVLDALVESAVSDISLRIVGGPTHVGRDLARRYPAVAYLGRLENDALRAEAATWTAFLNPIFCLPRGCSTKLATALAWHIPVVTTTQGRRGYVWRNGTVIEANSAKGFVSQMRQLLSADVANEARLQTIAVAQSSPAIEEIASTLGAFLADVAYSRLPGRNE